MSKHNFKIRRPDGQPQSVGLCWTTTRPHPVCCVTFGQEGDLEWHDLFRQSSCSLWPALFDESGNVREPSATSPLRFPVITPWPRPSLLVQEAADPAHRIETAFLLQVLEHYGLAVAVTGYENGDSAEATDRNRARITRALLAWRQRHDAVVAKTALRALHDDLADLKKLLNVVKLTARRQGEDLFERFWGPMTGARGTPFRILYLSSLFDRLGKWSTGKSFGELRGTPPAGEGLIIARDHDELIRSILGRKRINGEESPKFGIERGAAFVEFQAMRDIGRWLRHGVAPWARQWNAERRTPEDRFFRILFVDDELKADEPTSQLEPNGNSDLRDTYASVLREILLQLRRNFRLSSGNFEVYVLNRGQNIFPHSGSDKSIAHLDNYMSKDLVKHISRFSLDEEDANLSKSWTAPALESYDAIFCGVQYADPWGGPQIIHTIASYLERAHSKSIQNGTNGQIGTALIVLTNNNRFEQAHECLNLGADGFITKERVLQAPVRLLHAIEDMRRRFDMEEVRGENRDGQSERFGHRTNFRVLHGLSLEHKARLKSETADRLVIGDSVDRQWLRQLPKADLHVHLGPSISLPVIEALAWNTVGHLIDRSKPVRDGDPLNHHRHKVMQLVLTAFLAAFKNCPETTRVDRDLLMRHLHDAVEQTVGADGRAPPRPDRPRGRPLQDMLNRLNWADHAVPTHAITAIVVASLSLLRIAQSGDSPKILEARTRARLEAQWRVLSEIHAWTKQDSLPSWCRFAVTHSNDVLSRLRTGGGRSDKANILKTTVDAVLGSTGRAIQEVIAALFAIGPMQGLQNLPNDWPAVASLAEIVTVPATGDGHRFGLLSYLDGCELLGSDHLQFPENIVLAATDFVRQNVEDSVVYAEVRCETPGYTKAGLSGLAATQLLQASFDLAAAFYNQSPAHKTMLTRVNILLAAKRHKSLAECARVVSLLERYVEQDGNHSLLAADPEEAPTWWAPSRVVGFDLSGNENKIDDKVRDEIARLFQYNTAITVHAGEAASAESVWQAVYGFHARRIGHGLRLRENRRLMRYCIDEGICMELCPSSNTSTHGFPYLDTVQQYVAARDHAYPLRQYMEMGLEVCINTDNRALTRPIEDKFENSYHPNRPLDRDPPMLTVTDEYLRAARLSGGLSRWEVLKLIRAGFKHAFLHRNEIAELLSAVENRSFGLVGQEPGTSWWDGSHEALSD